MSKVLIKWVPSELPKNSCMISGRTCDGSRKNCCTVVLPCDAGEGTCKSDDQCMGTLVCGKNNCYGDNFGANDNCCTEPEQDDWGVWDVINCLSIIFCSTYLKAKMCLQL